MEVKTTNYTIVEFLDQLREHSIIINRDYQRSSKVWPPAAKSYLIETILLGFPMPKLALFQKTDLKTRKTIKEVVDGQQRTATLSEYYNDKFRISGKSQFSGKTFSTLEEEFQRKFIEYSLSIDLIIGATDPEIRQLFRRINSYTVPLNPQEKRHATYQGAFKWFIADLTEQYSQIFKEIGVFSEPGLSRMNDAKLLSEIIYSFEFGIGHSSDSKIDKLYQANEQAFPKEGAYRKLFSDIWGIIAQMSDLHKSEFTKPFLFYSLFLAIGNALGNFPTLQSHLTSQLPLPIDISLAQTNLSYLNDELLNKNLGGNQKPFIEACSKATNRLLPRVQRFKTISEALHPILMK